MLKKPNAFMKNFNSNGKRQMSIERQITPQKSTSLQQVVHVVKSTKFHLLTAGGEDALNPNSLWKYTIVADPKIRKRHLVFKNTEYVVSNWTSDQFPQVFYIQAFGVSGYCDKLGNPTAKIAALELTDVNAVMDESMVRTYELRYVLRDMVTWQIPLSLLQLNFTVSMDTSAISVTLPLPNPMILNFEIRTQ